MNQQQIESAILYCKQHNYEYAQYKIIRIANKKFNVPLCVKNIFLCEYAGQYMPEYGSVICDKVLLRDQKQEFLEEKFDK